MEMLELIGWYYDNTPTPVINALSLLFWVGIGLLLLLAKCKRALKRTSKSENLLKEQVSRFAFALHNSETSGEKIWLHMRQWKEYSQRLHEYWMLHGRINEGSPDPPERPKSTVQEYKILKAQTEDAMKFNNIEAVKNIGFLRILTMGLLASTLVSMVVNSVARIKRSAAKEGSGTAAKEGEKPDM